MGERWKGYGTREIPRQFKRALGKVPFAQVGEVTGGGVFTVTGVNGKVVIEEPIAGLKESWQAPLRW